MNEGIIVIAELVVEETQLEQRGSNSYRSAEKLIMLQLLS